MPEDTQQQPEVAAETKAPEATAAPAATAPAEPKMRVRFKADFKSPALHIANGPYRRSFVVDVNAAPDGFECTQDEYENFLRPLGFFELVEQEEKAADPAGQTAPDGQAANPATASAAEQTQTPPATEQPATS